jgi:peptidoglycan/xylan/chitin deacetylase (PgdA/CDA1 family)
MISRRSLVRTVARVVGVGVLAAACSSPPARHSAESQPRAARTTTTATSSSTTATPAPATQPPTTVATAPTTSSTVTPAPSNLSRLFGRVWQQIPTASSVVALTFDAGANGDGVSSILSTLRRDGVPATFFLTGAFSTSFPDLARSIVSEGHPVGDHTVDHPHLTTLPDAKVVAEVTDAATTIRTVTGTSPLPLFRFPYGESDARTLAVVNGLGYVAVGWTVDTLGWEGTSAGITTTSIVARVVAGLRPGEIVLMHVGSNPDDHSTLDADALPSVIASVRAAGYSFVTLSALLGSA